MVPRGLRLRKSPTTIFSESFMNEWYAILSNCSLSLMKLIMQQETIKMQALQEEISAARVELDKHKDAEGFAFFNDRM